ncbi:hypothetical protein [Nocardiopsis potens]|uniref:hypothetical protein n=1 Tax=Nocardiopsis potens TaxID=1246458 RepID=UPI00034D96CE|nr:hypothetical protein [Nocardiopsis potens]
MIVAFILACEVLFWVLVLGGLAVRYLLRMPRTSTALLLSVPVLDVVLLGAIALHLAGGGTAELGHGLGALYLGFTVAFGHTVIRWADVRFAHRFAGGPPPARPPRKGAPAIRREALGWLQTTLACAIGAAVLVGLILFTGDPERTAVLNGYFTPLGIVMFWNTVIAAWGILSALTGGDGEEARERPVPVSAAAAPAGPGAPAAEPAAARPGAPGNGAPERGAGRRGSTTALWAGGVLLTVAVLSLGAQYLPALFTAAAFDPPRAFQLVQAGVGAALLAWGLTGRRAN